MMYRNGSFGRVASLALLVALAGCGESSGDPIDSGMPDPDGGSGDAGPPDAGLEMDAPSAAVVFPAHDSLTDEDTLIVRGTASDASTISEVRVDGVLAVSSDGFATWTATIPLSVGVHDLAVSTLDDLGNADAAAASVRVERSDVLLIEPLTVAYAAPDSAFVYDSKLYSIVEITLSTGARSVLSPEPLGAALRGLTYDAANSRLLYATYDEVKAVAVDTGVVTVLSSNAVTSAVDFDSISGAVFTSTVGYVADSGLNVVMAVDLTTGVRTELSGSVGTGTAIASPGTMQLNTAGTLLLLHNDRYSASEVLEIEIATGNRTTYGVISSSITNTFAVDSSDLLVHGRGNGRVDRTDGMVEQTLVTLNRPTGMAYPSDVTLISDTQALMVDERTDGLFQLDLTMGTGTEVSRSSVGNGEPFYFSNPSSTAGDLVYVIDDAESGNVLQLDQIDLTTGLRVEISGDDVGSGPGLTNVSDVKISADGTKVWVMQGAFAALNEIDVATGARVAIASDGTVTGGPMGRPEHIAVDEGADLVYLLDTNTPNRVLELDLGTSAVTVLASDVVGTGVAFSNCDDMVLDGARILLACSTGVVAVDITGGVRTLAAPTPGQVRNLAVAGGGVFFYSRYSDLWRVDGVSAAVEIVSPTDALPTGLLGGMDYDAAGDRLTMFSDWRHSMMTIDAQTGERVIVYR